MMSTARSTTASLSDAKNRKTGLLCQAGREDGIGVAMTWGGYFPREPRCVQRESCLLLVLVRTLVPKLQLGNAIGLRSFASGAGLLRKRGPAKQSFEDKGIPKLELGNEGELERVATRFYPGLRGNCGRSEE